MNVNKVPIPAATKREETSVLTSEEKQGNSSWSCSCLLLLCTAEGRLPGFNLILKNLL